MLSVSSYLIILMMILTIWLYYHRTSNHRMTDNDVYAGSTFNSPYETGITLIPTIVSKNKQRYYGVQNAHTKQWTWQRSSPFL